MPTFQRALGVHATRKQHVLYFGAVLQQIRQHRPGDPSFYALRVQIGKQLAAGGEDLVVQASRQILQSLHHLDFDDVEMRQLPRFPLKCLQRRHHIRQLCFRRGRRSVQREHVSSDVRGEVDTEHRNRLIDGCDQRTLFRQVIRQSRDELERSSTEVVDLDFPIDRHRDHRELHSILVDQLRTQCLQTCPQVDAESIRCFRGKLCDSSGMCGVVLVNLGRADREATLRQHLVQLLRAWRDVPMPVQVDLGRAILQHPDPRDDRAGAELCARSRHPAVFEVLNSTQLLDQRVVDLPRRGRVILMVGVVRELLQFRRRQPDKPAHFFHLRWCGAFEPGQFLGAHRITGPRGPQPVMRIQRDGRVFLEKTPVGGQSKLVVISFQQPRLQKLVEPGLRGQRILLHWDTLEDGLHPGNALHVVLGQELRTEPGQPGELALRVSQCHLRPDVEQRQQHLGQLDLLLVRVERLERIQVDDNGVSR